MVILRYVPERLNEQLDEQGRIFLSQTNKNYFNFEKKEAKVSKIFDWFKDDFKKNAPSVLEFISRYLPEEQAQKLLADASSFKVKQTKYDWKLNDWKMDE